MHKLLDQTNEALCTIDPSDPITECPASVLSLLPSQPDPLLSLAHSKMHTFPFYSVPVCWRRLYTDASVAKAVGVMRKGFAAVGDGDAASLGGVRSSKRAISEGGGSFDTEAADDDGWVDEVVKILDMASIMAGAVGRAEMIERLLSALQKHLDEDRFPQKKRRRKMMEMDYDSFPVARHLDAWKVPLINNPIQITTAPSMQAFETHMETGQPLLVKEALTHWPALQERPWSRPSYLLERTFGGRRLIPVEIGRSYTDPDWSQSIITFREFMEKYMLLREEEGADDRSKIGYLAQHDLFAQIPSLRNDIAVPDYCYTAPSLPPSAATGGKSPPPHLEEPLLNAWFGPPGTVSPLHTDPYHNILCQVVGKKYVRLYSPEQTDKLYPKGVEGGGVDMSNTSEVDVEGAREELDAEFPLFRGAEYVETILGEGECLYIPVGWWHYVRSLSVSFSVSFWWN
ncbi:MAG: hypothetical protein LQ338_000018 [Usnochroma carphineum]|nr:MAG: hypothetical protein LQ338_000018 [Usnochroma carphineum]